MFYPIFELGGIGTTWVGCQALKSEFVISVLNADYIRGAYTLNSEWTFQFEDFQGRHKVQFFFLEGQVPSVADWLMLQCGVKLWLFQSTHLTMAMNWSVHTTELAMWFSRVAAPRSPILFLHGTLDFMFVAINFSDVEGLLKSWFGEAETYIAWWKFYVEGSDALSEYLWGRRWPLIKYDQPWTYFWTILHELTLLVPVYWVSLQTSI